MNPMNPAGPYSYSYSGFICGPEDSAPPLRDIAVALGRLCRWSGNGASFWPVLLHSFVVADLLPVHLKKYGLLHDSAESIMGEVPRRFKTAEYAEMEDRLHAKILWKFGLKRPNEDETRLIKLADDAAGSAEAWTVGPVGAVCMCPHRDKQAEALTMGYLQEFPAVECINPGGRAVVEFVRRVANSLEVI